MGILALTAAACGSSSSSTGAATSTASATPTPPITKGGIMNIGSPQEPTSFLAAGITDSMTFSYAIDAPITEGLLWYKSTEETANAKSIADYYQPWLATEIPTVANGDVKTSGCANSSAQMCVTWKLRKGVVWHDGSAFTSHDVCATVDFFYVKYGVPGKTNPTSILSTSGWDQMIRCTETDANTAVVDFKSIYAPYLSLLTGVYGVIPSKQLDVALNGNTDLEKTPKTVDLSVGSGNTDAFKGTDTLDKIVNGTGPYVLQAYVPTQTVTLVPNKNYWNKSHLPNLDKVVFHFVADVQTQLNQTKAGELDFGMDYRLKFLKDLQTTAQLGKVAVETIPESGAEKIDINICATAAGKCGGPPAQQNLDLADHKLRAAMIEAINRSQIVATIASGATVIPADGWQYLGATYARPPASQDPTTAYSVSKSTADLDAAGYKLSPSCHGGLGRADSSGTCLDFGFVTTSGNPARAAAQVAIQQDLQAVGIYVNLTTIKAGKIFGAFSDGGVLYTHTFDLAMYTNTMSAPAEVDSYYPGYVSTQIPSAANQGMGQNDTGENNPQVDAGFNQGRSSIDLQKRAQGYQRAIATLAADLPEIPLYQQVTVNSYTIKLQGLLRNDLVWTYNLYDWNCTGGVCQA
jgi:peptide/nickel transport system substrate-binding protein